MASRDWSSAKLWQKRFAVLSTEWMQLPSKSARKKTARRWILFRMGEWSLESFWKVSLLQQPPSNPWLFSWIHSNLLAGKIFGDAQIWLNSRLTSLNLLNNELKDSGVDSLISASFSSTRLWPSLSYAVLGEHQLTLPLAKAMRENSRLQNSGHTSLNLSSVRIPPDKSLFRKGPTQKSGDAIRISSQSS